MTRIERPLDFQELRNLLREQPLEAENQDIGYFRRFANSRGRQAFAGLGGLALGMSVTALLSPPTAQNIFMCVGSAFGGSTFLATAANEELYQNVKERFQNVGQDFDRLRGLFRNLGGNEGFRESIFPRRLQEI